MKMVTLFLVPSAAAKSTTGLEIQESPNKVDATTSLNFSKLSKTGARQLRELLSGPTFNFLGRWRLNVTLLQDISAKLARGEVVIIDGFFSKRLAEQVLDDTLRGIGQGWLRPLGKHVNHSGIDLDVYQNASASSPEMLCEVLSNIEAQNGFKFQYQVLDPRGKSTPVTQKFPGHMSLFAGFNNLRWRQAMLTLLGLDTQAAKGAAVQAVLDPPYFREFQPGDYATFHNDLGGSTRRMLCLNYWFPTGAWMPEIGGNFLWCGAADQAGQRKTKRFSHALRVVPKFNQASIFVPSRESWHAVELVHGHEKPLDVSASSMPRRFSFTSWLELPLATAFSLSRGSGSDSVVKLEL